MGNVGQQLGIADKFEAVRAEQCAQDNIGDQQRLTGIQSNRCQNRRTGENQEKRKYQALFCHLPVGPRVNGSKINSLINRR
ncbi:hypothetical protein [Aliamphritea spongicola]|nr:hypothetical protein [Aliamphritea spongicola]